MRSSKCKDFQREKLAADGATQSGVTGDVGHEWELEAGAWTRGPLSKGSHQRRQEA